MVPHIQIVHIEVMEGPRVEPARRALLDTFRERTTDGVVNPTQGDLFDHPDSDFLRHGTGVFVHGGDGLERDQRVEVVANRDPYENPDEAPESHHGKPVKRVELPAEGVERLPGETDTDYEAAVDAMEEAEEYGRERATS